MVAILFSKTIVSIVIHNTERGFSLLSGLVMLVKILYSTLKSYHVLRIAFNFENDVNHVQYGEIVLC